MNDSEHELRPETNYGGDTTADPDERAPDTLARPAMTMDYLSAPATDRIQRFMAESTVRGGASPADVADLYTSQEIVDDDDATAYLDRRFVHGEVLNDWRAFQDRLSAAYLDGAPGTTSDALLARAREQEDLLLRPRSIFDDPDEEDLLNGLQIERMEGRDPSLNDLGVESRRAIERYIVTDVLCYGVAPYKVMELREGLRTEGDERALQYLDLPFELGDRPSDWDALRSRALMIRARLEGVGVDPAAAFDQADSSHPGLEASALLAILDERDFRR